MSMENAQDLYTRIIDTLREVVTHGVYSTSESVPIAGDIIDRPGHRRGNVPTISYAIRMQSTLMNS